MTHNGQLFGRLDDPSICFVLPCKQDMSVLISRSYRRSSLRTHRKCPCPRPKFPSHQSLQFTTIKISIFDDLPFPTLRRGGKTESAP